MSIPAVYLLAHENARHENALRANSLSRILRIVFQRFQSLQLLIRIEIRRRLAAPPALAVADPDPPQMPVLAFAVSRVRVIVPEVNAAAIARAVRGLVA